MLKLYKKIISSVLGIALITASFPNAVFEASAVSTFEYEIYSEIPGGSSPVTKLDLNNSVDIWINGGKAIYASGTVAETKTAQLTLYEIAYDNTYFTYGYYNITSLKGIEWYVGDTPNGANMTNGKFANKNDYISISKGKVTAGKTPGVAYAYAYRAAAEKSGTPTLLAVAKIVIKLAPQKMAIYDRILGSDGAVAIKDLTIGLGSSKTIFPVPEMSKSTDNAAMNSSEYLYSVSVDKNSTAVTLSTGYQTALPGQPLNNITANELALGINIQGNEIVPDTKVVNPVSDDRMDKPAKVSVTITNQQSGKSVKLPVNIENYVTNFIVPDYVQNVYITKDYIPSPIVINLNPTLSGMFLYPAYYGSSTVKPLIGVYSTNQSENFASFIDAKGKLKLPTANKSSDVTVSVSNKANTKLDVRFKKAVYNEPKSVYIVVAYGTDVNTQIKQFQLTLFTPAVVAQSNELLSLSAS